MPVPGAHVDYDDFCTLCSGPCRSDEDCPNLVPDGYDDAYDYPENYIDDYDDWYL